MAPTDINPTATRQVFLSSDQAQRIVRVPAHDTLGHTADQLITRPALAYDFEDGYLVIDDRRRAQDEAYFEQWAEKLGLSCERDEDGNRVGAWDGDLADKWRPNQSAEEWLRAHERFGIPHGFAEIPAMQASSAGPLAKITELVLAGDVDALVELYVAEESGERREDVLRTCAQAIETLEARAQEAPTG